MAFNKYQWIREQEAILIESIHNDPEMTLEQLQYQVECDIYNDCIYYSDCFEIIAGLNYTHWEENITNVSQAAHAALLEFASEALDISSLLEETLNTIQNS